MRRWSRPVWYCATVWSPSRTVTCTPIESAPDMSPSQNTAAPERSRYVVTCTSSTCGLLRSSRESRASSDSRARPSRDGPSTRASRSLRSAGSASDTVTRTLPTCGTRTRAPPSCGDGARSEAQAANAASPSARTRRVRSRRRAIDPIVPPCAGLLRNASARGQLGGRCAIHASERDPVETPKQLELILRSWCG